jgi:hypothetical protein
VLTDTLSALAPELKAKYGSIFLLDISQFRSSIELGSQILLRAMTRSEFNLFSEMFLIDPVAAVNYVIKNNVYGLDFPDLYLAGIDEYICAAISKISGFSSADSLVEGVEYGRANAKTLESAITMYICKAFPSLSPSDVDNMTLNQQMKYVSMAEIMIGQELPYEDFLNPKKPKASKPPRHIMEPPPPDPRFKHSAVNQQAEETHEHVVVTKDNIHEVMKQTREIFRG